MSVDLDSIGVFQKARAGYVTARNAQRNLIAGALKAAGFSVKTRGIAGRGLRNYTSGGRLDPPFDLSNWMWVAGQRDDVFVTVSLQTLDRDPNSGNIHALMDRIGIDVYRADDPVDAQDPLSEKSTTGLQLPLDHKGLSDLISLVEQRAAKLH
ncbi:hypothetical protein NQ038_11505 [Brevibacterium sp. 50QC2O2]|uniref:hypothetical protein n=1 Tax=Brevibacterium TaxID=1696 RepID=UPI00211CD5B2|nr:MULTISPECIES: hypothetical protein [unclassified Brevibacterium]MCQ9384679.1 hypothetical protein [Brevibacterium sp. 68QC2CO]MCQ9389265.1 hypothetical protein [Brevibacterium sp. 50QC2O2]